MNRIFIILLISLTSSCISNNQYKTQVKLVAYDNLLNSNPQAAYDSLKTLVEQPLNKKNSAYFNLLLTIASDRINRPFISDSIINQAYNWYKGLQVDNTTKQFNQQNLIRAALYRGIVKYNINNSDSSAYHCLKEAQVLAGTNNKMIDNNTFGLITFYLGNIQNVNKCYTNAADYYNKAANHFAKSNQDENYIRAKIAYVNTLYNMGDSNKAIIALDYLKNYQTNSTLIRHNIYGAISTFYSSIKEYQKAMQYRLKCLHYDSLLNSDQRADILAMAKHSLYINNTKDALKYAIMLDSVLNVTEHLTNYEYLNELSVHYLKLNQVQKALEYKMNAYEDLEYLYSSSIIRTSNKYENLYKNLQSKLIKGEVKTGTKNLIFYIIITILVFTLCTITSILIILLKKEKRYSKQILYGKKQLDVTINQQLHSIIKQMSFRHANFIDSASSQLLTIEDDSSRKITRKLFENYKKEYKQGFFNNIPYMPGKEKLSDQEKAVDFLNSLKFSEQEIADIILTSRTGINTQKNRIHDKTSHKETVNPI